MMFKGSEKGSDESKNILGEIILPRKNLDRAFDSLRDRARFSFSVNVNATTGRASRANAPDLHRKRENRSQVVRHSG